MTLDELRQEIDAIIAHSYDPEVAHDMEDEIHIALINIFCPDWVKAEVERLSDAEFPRWYA